MSSRRDKGLQAPLLDPFAEVAHQVSGGAFYDSWWTSAARLGKDFSAQLSLAGPLAVNLVAANAAAVVNLYFVSRGGTMQLAAAALGNNVAVMLGRLVLMGLCGALDTLAAQAWGAGKEFRLPLLLQRTVLFLWVHCVGLSAAMMVLPAGLRALGQDPRLAAMVQGYLAALLPAVWLEALSRPITRVLVARGVATPQMVIALVGLPLNVATNYLLVVVAGWEYLGAAVAVSAAAGYDVVLLLSYVAFSGQWSGVIGEPNRRALRGWRQLARLAYPAASMKCAESWAFTIMTLAASLLPHACTATAAVGVAYNVYGVLFIAFVACSTAACVTVGNRLGAGDARGAKLAAAGSLLIAPLAWGLAALALLLPYSQDLIMDIFVTDGGGGGSGDGDGDRDAARAGTAGGLGWYSPDSGQAAAGAPSWSLSSAVAAAAVALMRRSGGGEGGDVGGGGDEELRHVLRHMFVIVAGLVLLDGIQTILSGVIQGCGRQQAGALVNLMAFYVFAVPLGLLLGFRTRLPTALGGGWLGLGLGPEGLYLGMAAGPIIQTVSYSYILLCTNWERASEAAVSAARMQSTSSIASTIRRLDPGALGGITISRLPSLGTTGSAPPWLLPAILEASESSAGRGTDSSDGSSVRLWLRSASGEAGDGSVDGAVGSGGVEEAGGGGEAGRSLLGREALGATAKEEEQEEEVDVGAVTAVTAAAAVEAEAERVRGVLEGSSSTVVAAAAASPSQPLRSWWRWPIGNSIGNVAAAPPPPSPHLIKAAAATAAGSAAATDGMLPYGMHAMSPTVAAATAATRSGVIVDRAEEARHCLLAATLDLDLDLDPDLDVNGVEVDSLSPGSGVASMPYASSGGRSPPLFSPAASSPLRGRPQARPQQLQQRQQQQQRQSEQQQQTQQPWQWLMQRNGAALPTAAVVARLPTPCASAPVPVPAAAGSVATAVVAGGAGGGASRRWYHFGWGGAAAATKPPAAAAVVRGGSAADAAVVRSHSLVDLPLSLQLPGIDAEGVAAGERAAGVAACDVADGSGGTVADGAFYGVSKGAPAVGLAEPMPIVFAFARHQNVSTATEGSHVKRAAGGDELQSTVGAAGGCSGGGGGDGGGEVYRSCESLAAAIPGSGDFYAFSASAGTDGCGWLDGPSSSPQQQQRAGDPSPPARFLHGGDVGRSGLGFAGPGTGDARKSALCGCDGASVGAGGSGVGAISNGGDNPSSVVKEAAKPGAVSRAMTLVYGCANGGGGGDESDETKYYDARAHGSSSSLSSLSIPTAATSSPR